MPYGEDISAFFGEGVTATFGAESTTVWLDQHDEDVLHGRVQSTAYRMTFPATHFATLTHNSALTVNGVAYVVHVVNKLDDGATRQAILYQYP